MIFFSDVILNKIICIKNLKILLFLIIINDLADIDSSYIFFSNQYL